MSPHISASETAARPWRGMSGIVSGVDDDLFSEVGLMKPLRPRGEGDGLDLGVKNERGVDERCRPRGSCTGRSGLSGESSDKKVSDMTSDGWVSFVPEAGDMAPPVEGRPGTDVGSTVPPPS